jgi:hypothetical protein
VTADITYIFFNILYLVNVMIISDHGHSHGGHGHSHGLGRDISISSTPQYTCN